MIYVLSDGDQATDDYCLKAIFSGPDGLSIEKLIQEWADLPSIKTVFNESYRWLLFSDFLFEPNKLLCSSASPMPLEYFEQHGLVRINYQEENFDEMGKQ